MAWLADWFATCDKCGDCELMDGGRFKAAKKTAREKGWSVSARRVLCPNCRPKSLDIRQKSVILISP